MSWQDDPELRELGAEIRKSRPADTPVPSAFRAKLRRQLAETAVESGGFRPINLWATGLAIVAIIFLASVMWSAMQRTTPEAAADPTTVATNALLPTHTPSAIPATMPLPSVSDECWPPEDAFVQMSPSFVFAQFALTSCRDGQSYNIISADAGLVSVTAGGVHQLIVHSNDASVWPDPMPWHAVGVFVANNCNVEANCFTEQREENATPFTGERLGDHTLRLSYELADAPQQVVVHFDFCRVWSGSEHCHEVDGEWQTKTLYVFRYMVVGATEPTTEASVQQAGFALHHYPPSAIPYRIAEDDFWLVHTPAGQMLAFAPFAPTYHAEIAMEACRYEWNAAVQRFVDPCSGDEWNLDGTLNLEHSHERWSNRDLDQYVVRVQNDRLFVSTDQLHEGREIGEQPLAMDAHYGVTLTVVSAEFDTNFTTIDTLVQVDSLWEMMPQTFPPQQALTYATFPTSLIDDQGRVIASTAREGGLAVVDPRTGDLQQLMHNSWEGVAVDAQSITVTLTVDLSNIYRTITLPIDWENHTAGDSWDANLLVSIGHAAVRIRQIEWMQTDDTTAQLKLAIVAENPEDISLYCLHIDTSDPFPHDCANFDGEAIYFIETLVGKALQLHTRTSLEIQTPFQLRVMVE